jgi:hypothetical protein
MSMKNCNDTIGNRTSDLQACSAVHQPTAPPLAPPPHTPGKSDINLFSPVLRKLHTWGISKSHATSVSSLWDRNIYMSCVNTAQHSTCKTTCCPPGPIRGQKDFKLNRSLYDVYIGWCKHTSLFQLQKPAVLLKVRVWVTAGTWKTERPQRSLCLGVMVQLILRVVPAGVNICFKTLNFILSLTVINLLARNF